MNGYIVRRILATAPVMGVVAVFVFFMMKAGGADPAAIVAGDAASLSDIAEIRQRMGLAQPLHEQFWDWLSGVVQGDFGNSFYNQQPVSDLILQRLEPTVCVGLSVLVFSTLLAVPIGIVAAHRVGTWIDRAVMVFAALAFSVPVFLLGYVLIFTFSLSVPVFPVQGYTDFAEGVVPFLRHIALPTITLGLVHTALLARITRASMLEVLQEDYIRTARAKGVGTLKVLLRHALKNASVPIATIVGVSFAGLISGVVITETVFGIHGLGRLTADSILHRDYPVIQAVVLLFSAVYVVVNLIVDLLYTVLDPRIRY
jgi:peptide/nickel transport system permease protein